MRIAPVATSPNAKCRQRIAWCRTTDQGVNRVTRLIHENNDNGKHGGASEWDKTLTRQPVVGDWGRQANPNPIHKYPPPVEQFWARARHLARRTDMFDGWHGRTGRGRW